MKILGYTSPARGHLFPLIPILTELRDRGHLVSVRTLAGSVDVVRSLGLSAHAVDPRIEAIEHDDFTARSAVGAVKRSTATFVKRSEFESSDLASAISSDRPELLLIDTNCWGAAAVAEASGLPWASWLPYPAPFPGKGIPPFGPGFAPAGNRQGRLRDAVLGRLITTSVARTIRPPLNAVRASIGVPELRDTREVFTRPPLTLYLTAEPFEYHRVDWPASFRLVGPVSYDPPADPPPGLAEIDRPIVLVTTSSEFQDDARLVATTLTALEDEDVFVIATLPAGDPAGIDIPANAWVEHWIPHSALLPRAACVITHGGMGATQKALSHGVPVVAVPFGRDQLEVARRVEVSGAGVRLPLRRLTAARLRAAVREATARSGRAGELAQAMNSAGGAPKAADEIEQLAATWTAGPEATVPS
ncbi:glycosyltransferase [uncultured Jatrophihabitans sp.]|uniref:glycosyltransferase n=1 Tax=uncultured Jatrophihabitans sp. TaxID=1610747 RepID=UPI0035CC2B0D